MRSDEIRPGDLVAGKYRVRAILSRSRGMLVEAFHTEFDQRVVIRILSPAMCDAKEIERFRREARTLAKLESEHVARIFDVGTEADGAFYFVRQYLEGQDLAAHLKKRGRLPLPEAVLYVLQAAEAMAETHSHQIILREMQPQHLFLTQRLGVSLVKVVDFGTAKLLRDAAPPGAGGELTATTMFGLSPYSSPELVRKAKNVDVRTDIWSLGTILYELLAGKPPFQGEMAALMLAITKDDPVPLTQLRPDLPREMDHVIGWCLAKDIDRRFTNVHAFAHALLPYAPPEGQVLVTRIGAMASAAKKRPASVPPPPPPAGASAGAARPQSPAAKQQPPKITPRPAAGRPVQSGEDSDSVTNLHGIDLVDDEDEAIATKIMTSPAELMNPQKPGPAGPRPSAGQPAAQPGGRPQSTPPPRRPPASPPSPSAQSQEQAGGGEAPFERTVFIGADFVPPQAGPAKPPAPAQNRPPGGQPMFAGAAQGMEMPQGSASPGAQQNRPNSIPGTMPSPNQPMGGGQQAGPGGNPSVLGPQLNLDAPRPQWGPAPADGNRQPTPMATAMPVGPPSFGPPPPSSAVGTGPHSAMAPAPNAGARKVKIAAIAAAGVLLPALALALIFGGSSDKPGPATDATGAMTVPSPSASPALPSVTATASEAPTPAATPDLPVPTQAPTAVSVGTSSPPNTAAVPTPTPTNKPTGAIPTATAKASATSTTTAPPASTPTATAAAGGGDMGTLVAVAVGGTCAFSVNGASKGSGSSIKVPLKAGSYSVSCKPPSGATKTRSVNVSSGGTAMAMFKLQ
jgi:serine/threonine protein kinase